MEQRMRQARILGDNEIKKILDVIERRRHAARDRAILLLGIYAGLTVKELSSLRICNVLTSSASIRTEIHLSPEQTKSQHGRSVLLSAKSRSEIQSYLLDRFQTNDLQPILLTDTTRPLFSTQKGKRGSFSANTLAGHFGQLMKDAGITGASSQSLKNSFIARMADTGVSIRVIQALSGHADITSTLRMLPVCKTLMHHAVNLV
jgi:integrase/recombinase XerD